VVKRTPAGPSPAPGASGGGFTVKDFLRVLRRRKWMILLTILLFTGAAVGGTFLWLKVAPRFTAVAYLSVTPPKSSFMTGGDIFLNRDIMDRQLQDYAQTVSSPAVLGEALAHDDVRKTDWFGKVSVEKTDLVRELQEEIRVGPVPNTSMIRVSMTGPSGRDVTNIVNVIVNAAVEKSRNTTESRRDDDIRKLQQGRGQIETTREENQKKIDSLRSRGVGAETVKEENVLKYTAQALTQERIRVLSAYVQAVKMWEVISSQTDEELQDFPEVRRIMQFDPILHNLELQVMQLEAELEHLRTKYGDEYQRTRDMKGRVEMVRQQMENKKKEVADRAIADLKMGRESMLQSTKAEYLTVEEKVKDTEAKLQALEEMNSRLDAAIKEVDKADTQILEIDRRLVDLQLLKWGEAPMLLKQPAELPTEPSWPTFTVMAPLGVFLGVLFGLGLAFLLEFMDTSIKAPSDVTRRVELPMLGMVPHLDDIEEEIADLRLAFLTHPNTLVDEAFRQLRTTLMFSGPAEQRRSIVVTSPMPEDGRTAVTLNLAHAMARGGNRVLVVDANFRQPAIHSLFPMCPEDGLSTVLVGQGDWRGLTYEVEPGLHVMAAGPLPPNPAELLGSERMRTVIGRFQEDFDQVIIDSSPCLVVSDASVISTMVDGVVLAVRAGVNTYGIVQRARDMLSRLGAHIFGVVLNGVRITAGGYLRKNYETFYEYRQARQLPADVPAHAAAAADSGDSET
jgi:capsular exopolysaccharide synthesis family protein